LKFDQILTIENLEKHLILELSFLAIIYISIASQEKAVTVSTNE
jgi:hypothetical protein